MSENWNEEVNAFLEKSRETVSLLNEVTLALQSDGFEEFAAKAEQLDFRDLSPEEVDALLKDLLEDAKRCVATTRNLTQTVADEIATRNPSRAREVN